MMVMGCPGGCGRSISNRRFQMVELCRGILGAGHGHQVGAQGTGLGGGFEWWSASCGVWFLEGLVAEGTQYVVAAADDLAGNGQGGDLMAVTVFDLPVVAVVG